MTIYALKGSSEWFDMLSSLKQGVGRFGWSYIKSANLNKLKPIVEKDGWDALNDEEKDCYQIFLLDIVANDNVVYINVPEWGKCTIARVTGNYYWEYSGKDFNHCFSVDLNSIYIFNRNDAIVHPALSSRLKLQGRWWRINLNDEFKSLLRDLSTGVTPVKRTPEISIQTLSKEIQPFLGEITKSVHHTHPNRDLEILVAEVFKHVPGVIDVKPQGGRGDHGADILVKFSSGMPIPGLEQNGMLVVQVKSFGGEHWDTQAIEDIRRAFKQYPDACMGLIVSTADLASKNFETELEKLKEEAKKPIALLIGSDVAAFFLRFGAKLLA